MNVLDAAYMLARDYPGGAQALGLRLSKPNLSDELNPHRPAAKLGLQTAVDMEVLAGDYRILYAHALACQHFPPLPMPDAMPAEAPCLRTLSDLSGHFVAVVQEVTGDLADNRVSDNELKRARAAWDKLLMTGQAMMHQLAAMNAALQAGGGDA